MSGRETAADRDAVVDGMGDDDRGSAAAAGGASVESPDALDPATRAALRRQIVSLADSKRLLGIRYSDWVLGAPSLEANIATSSMAQDEWGHARLLYAMLKDFGEDPTAIEHDRDAGEYASVGPLDEPFGDWAEVVTGMVIIDGTLTVALEGVAEGVYAPARARIPKMVAEEAFHRDLGVAWFRRLAAGSDEGRARLRGAVEAFAPAMLHWLSPGDGPARALEDAGLTVPGRDLVHRVIARVGEMVDGAGIDLGSVGLDGGEWDEARGRGPGQPGAEAVERARGDLNRVLFVE